MYVLSMYRNIPKGVMLYLTYTPVWTGTKAGEHGEQVVLTVNTKVRPSELFEAMRVTPLYFGCLHNSPYVLTLWTETSHIDRTIHDITQKINTLSLPSNSASPKPRSTSLIN